MTVRIKLRDGTVQWLHDGYCIEFDSRGPHYAVYDHDYAFGQSRKLLAVYSADKVNSMEVEP